MTAPSAPTERTRVRRSAIRADYDSATLHAIIDDAWLCHVAFHDGASTHCIPTACWREGEHLYIHGSNGGRLTRLLMQGTQSCVTITHLDGLVMARAAFNHSMNYRSAVVYGQFEAVDGEADKRAAMAAFIDKVAPGRHADVRPGSDKEYAATTVMRIALTEAVCKVRTGGPVDDADDMASAAWVGVLPMALQRAAPVPEPDCSGAEPAYVTAWRA
jgi:nitroimidazol reductase NimA-like FMN-containing flavoprotein (pyridoxamine 5'-phosphate oxidase superfamily)